MKQHEVYPVITRGFSSQIEGDAQLVILKKALDAIGSKGKSKTGEQLPDFIIFDPHYTGREYQDEGRSLKMGMENIPEKVYAKVDDYGSKEELSKALGRDVKTQYVLTLMLANEY